MRALYSQVIILCCMSTFSCAALHAQTTSPVSSMPIGAAHASHTDSVSQSQNRLSLILTGAKKIETPTSSATEKSGDNESNESEDSSSLIRGALMLCGGGPLPESLFRKFFELGQANNGSLVIIPSASGRADAGDFAGSIAEWKNFPWSRIEVLHAKDRKQAESSESLVEPLKRATAVWISGGDQRRLAERYLGTPVEREIQSVVRRGGIVGGTSAGSAIASRVMITGGKQKPMISNGIDLLPGSIIDMHFSQRKRHDRLSSAIDLHPDRIGFGIDEGTGLVVSSTEAEVLGNGSVYVYSRNADATEKSEPLRFDAGSAFRITSSPIPR